jgi:hypothetical protein
VAYFRKSEEFGAHFGRIAGTLREFTSSVLSGNLDDRGHIVFRRLHRDAFLINEIYLVIWYRIDVFNVNSGLPKFLMPILSDRFWQFLNERDSDTIININVTQVNSQFGTVASKLFDLSVQVEGSSYTIPMTVGFVFDTRLDSGENGDEQLPHITVHVASPTNMMSGGGKEKVPQDAGAVKRGVAGISGPTNPNWNQEAEKVSLAPMWA